MKAKISKEIPRLQKNRQSGNGGFSLTELIIVMVIMAILGAISIPYIYNYKKLYKPEDQALKIMDLMREAGQMALTRRRTMRLEIDLTDNKILLIDEDTRVTPAVHRLIKAIPLESVSEVRMDKIPTGVSKPNPPNYHDVGSTDAPYVTDTTGHVNGSSTVNGHNVWAMRFRRDGSVVKSDNTLLSATLYVWSPAPGATASTPTPRKKEEVRAITIFGGTGAIRYWKHNGTTFKSF